MPPPVGRQHAHEVRGPLGPAERRPVLFVAAGHEVSGHLGAVGAAVQGHEAPLGHEERAVRLPGLRRVLLGQRAALEGLVVGPADRVLQGRLPGLDAQVAFQLDVGDGLAQVPAQLHVGARLGEAGSFQQRAGVVAAVVDVHDHHPAGTAAEPVHEVAARGELPGQDGRAHAVLADVGVDVTGADRPHRAARGRAGAHRTVGAQFAVLVPGAHHLALLVLGEVLQQFVGCGAEGGAVRVLHALHEPGQVGHVAGPEFRPREAEVVAAAREVGGGARLGREPAEADARSTGAGVCHPSNVRRRGGVHGPRGCDARQSDTGP